MRGQRDRECDVFPKAIWLCSAQMTEHTRKDTPCCVLRSVRAVCAGETLSQQILHDLSEALPATGTRLSVSAVLCPSARRLGCCSQQV